MKDLIWSFRIILLINWWVLNQFHLLTLQWMRFRMNFRRKWWRKSHVSFVISSHISHSSVNHVINCSANTVNFNWLNTTTKMTKNCIHKIRSSEHGEICQKRLIKNWNLLAEVEDWTPQNHQITEKSILVAHQTLMFAAQIVKSKVTFYKMWTRFWKTVSISVNSHIDALKQTMMDHSFGKHLVNCKHMLSLIVPNLDVISAIDLSFNIWREFSFKNIFETNAQKFLSCVKFAIRNMLEPILQVINVLKISILRSSSKMNTTSLKILLISSFFTEDRKKGSVCVQNTNALKSIEIIQTNIRKAWLLRIPKTVLLSVSDVRQLLRLTKIAISAFIVTKHIAQHVSDIANITILKKWNSFFLSEVRSDKFIFT